MCSDVTDSKSVLQAWRERGGEYSPRYYAHYGPNDTSESILEFVDALDGSDPSILEIGCSSGRHLAHLHDNGYRNVTGVDVNEDAVAVMKETFPDLAADATIYVDAIENVITEFDDREFDVVFSVETLQHIHHENEWVFEDVARITDRLLLTAELETDDDSDGTPVTHLNDDVPLYYRNWRRVFTEFGFEETDSRSVGRDTLRAFRRAT